MKHLTYQQAYNKIIEAYFKDQIRPEEPEFCFCGTLCSNRDSWSIRSKFRQRFHNYTFSEYGLMEKALFSTFNVTWNDNGDISINNGSGDIGREENYEEKLFLGMCAALEVLKEIHRSRGENVDDLPILTKRVLTY